MAKSENVDRRIQDLREEAELDKTLTRVVFFPGSINEYISAFSGEESVTTLDTRRKDLGITFRKANGEEHWECNEPLALKRILVEERITAIVNCQFVNEITRYGLPVRYI